MDEVEIITSGLKQAIARGETIEQAKQTFINAGYNAANVERASQIASGLKVAVVRKPVEVGIEPSGIRELGKRESGRESRKRSIWLKIAAVVILVAILVNVIIYFLYFG